MHNVQHDVVQYEPVSRCTASCCFWLTTEVVVTNSPAIDAERNQRSIPDNFNTYIPISMKILGLDVRKALHVLTRRCHMSTYLRLYKNHLKMVEICT